MGQCETLCDEVVIGDGKWALWEKIARDVEVAGGAGACCKRGLGEAVFGDVIDGGGEDGGFGPGEWWRVIMFIGMIEVMAAAAATTAAVACYRKTWTAETSHAYESC